jgi:mannose-6-phosphate isomerase-like protein (cupin superfamily)
MSAITSVKIRPGSLERLSAGVGSKSKRFKQEKKMSILSQYPYDTRLNVLNKHLELIDERALSDAAPHEWYNQTLCQVNASVVRLGVVEGEYHWHKHDHDDEFFYVVEGKLLVDLEGRTVELPGRDLWCRRACYTEREPHNAP